MKQNAPKTLRGFDGRAALATWFHRITINCAHNHVRKNRRFDRGRAEWNRETLGLVAVAIAHWHYRLPSVSHAANPHPTNEPTP
jgi:DNA-directed RNA polymerase specialized sigma24 family protein